MQVYSFSELSEETLRELVTLHIQRGVSSEWESMQEPHLTPAETSQIDYLKSILRERHFVVMNEGTLWARHLSVVSPRRARLHSSVDKRSAESHLSEFSIGRSGRWGPRA